MPERVDLFYNTYSNFTEQVLAAVREETFGKDIGQNSWLTADEYDRFISRMYFGNGIVSFVRGVVQYSPIQWCSPDLLRTMNWRCAVLLVCFCSCRLELTKN